MLFLVAMRLSWSLEPDLVGRNIEMGFSVNEPIATS